MILAAQVIVWTALVYAVLGLLFGLAFGVERVDASCVWASSFICRLIRKRSAAFTDEQAQRFKHNNA